VQASADTLTSAAARDEGAAAESRAHRASRWGLLAAPVALYAALGWSRHWMSDDGFIYLRVVRNVVEGHGPVFNVGERVEAATGPLWVAILAVGDAVAPIRLEWITVLLGLALSVAGFGFAILGSRRLLGITGTDLAVPVGAAVLIAIPPFWTFASSGLETGLAFAWLGLSLWILARWARVRPRLMAWEAVVLGLGSLIRPDFWLFTLAFLGIVVVTESESWRARAGVLAWALALPLLYQLFRMGYYGSLVPNPAIAKEASGSRWDVGWEYVRDSTSPYWLWAPLLVLAIGAYLPLVSALRSNRLRRELFVAGAFAIAAVVHTLFVIKVGGDFMHARLVLPALFAFAAPVAVVPWRRAYAASLLLVPWVVAGLFVLRSDKDRYDAFNGRKNPVTLDDFGWGDGGGARAFYTGPGVYYIDRRLPAKPADGRASEVAVSGIGVAGYALGPDVYILDMLGLGDAFTSHLELIERGFPGHEKFLPAPWTAARLTDPGAKLTQDDLPFPKLLVFGGEHPIARPRGLSFEEWVDVARTTLRCGQLADLQRSYSEPLTAGRFFDNVLDSFENSSLRIPPEPTEAQRRFC